MAEWLCFFPIKGSNLEFHLYSMFRKLSVIAVFILQCTECFYPDQIHMLKILHLMC
jgi:hypothetical protein